MVTSRFAAVDGSERGPVEGARVLGPLDAKEWIEVTLKLRRKKPLPAPDERSQMTRAALADAYGAFDADIERVTRAAGRYNLAVVSSSKATRSLRLAGCTAEIERFFDTHLAYYDHPSGAFRGRLGAVYLPEELKKIVVGVFGLDNRPQARRLHQRRLLTAKVCAATNRDWFFPHELGGIYDAPCDSGTPQSIGVVALGGNYRPDELASFLAFCGIEDDGVKVVPLSVSGASAEIDDELAGEVMLDVIIIASMCPRSTIPIYFSDFSEKGWIDVLDAAVHDDVNAPTVLSVSWGWPEEKGTWTAQAIDQMNEALKEAAHLGMTVCVASGDDGPGADVTSAPARSHFPSSSPFVVSVGGGAT